MILQATKLNEGKMHGVQHPGLSPHLSFFKMRKKHLPVFTISLPMSDLTQAYKLQEDLDTEEVLSRSSQEHWLPLSAGTHSKQDHGSLHSLHLSMSASPPRAASHTLFFPSPVGLRECTHTQTAARTSSLGLAQIFFITTKRLYNVPTKYRRWGLLTYGGNVARDTQPLHRAQHTPFLQDLCQRNLLSSCLVGPRDYVLHWRENSSAQPFCSSAGEHSPHREVPRFKDILNTHSKYNSETPRAPLPSITSHQGEVTTLPVPLADSTALLGSCQGAEGSSSYWKAADHAASRPAAPIGAPSHKSQPGTAELQGQFCKPLLCSVLHPILQAPRLLDPLTLALKHTSCSAQHLPGNCKGTLQALLNTSKAERGTEQPFCRGSQLAGRKRKLGIKCSVLVYLGNKQKSGNEELFPLFAPRMPHLACPALGFLSGSLTDLQSEKAAWWPQSCLQDQQHTQPEQSSPRQQK